MSGHSPERQYLLSVVTPAYNEEHNLPVLYERLCETLAEAPFRWEWIVVDDHSDDASFQIVSEIAGADERVSGFRLARNFGSHAALTCGLHNARGDCAVVMAADLQDPPEVITELVEKWHEGTQVVWAVRARREGESLSTVGFSRLYYWIMRRFVGLRRVPATGADFFLVDRRVMEALKQFDETNVSILMLLSWMGFRQDQISYSKRARLHGESGWSLRKKFKLVIDSITSFTYRPIRMMSYLGFLIASMGFVIATMVVIDKLLMADRITPGWASLMVIILVLGGLQMLMLGVLGEYLWRALDESRRRPRFLIESSVTRKEAPRADQ